LGLEASILAIPEPLLLSVPTILRDAGIVVEDLPADPGDDPLIFLKSLHCTGDLGVVRISIQREPNVNSDGLIVIICPDRHGKRENKTLLIHCVEEALKGHGAWIPVRAAT
jgi:hypothetical protein